MSTTIRARFSNGVLKPLEKLPLKEGDEVTLLIAEASSNGGIEALRRTAGAWAGLVECDRFEKDIYDSRLISTRPTPEL